MARIPIFRHFKHPELLKIGVPDGNADAGFLSAAATNTNRLIETKKHVPPVKQTHGGSIDGTARGWTKALSTDGATLFADVDLTPKGKQQVTDRELRFVSASFRRDFLLTGEPSGERLNGPYLDHIAFLGDENPAVKGLTDLTEVQFDDSEGGLLAWVSCAPDGKSLTFFSEVHLEDNQPEDADVTDIERLTEKVAQFDQKIHDVEARFTAEQTAHAATKKQLDEALATLKAQADATEAAKFAEHKSKIAARIKTAVEAKKLGADKAAALQAKGEKAYGNADSEAMFGELLDAMAPVVPTTRIPGAGEDRDDALLEGVTAADFKETTKDPAKIDRVHRATLSYIAKNPKTSYVDALAAVTRAAVSQS